MITRTEKWYKRKSAYALALLIVMVASTIGFALVNNNTTGQGTSNEYNGYTFVATPQGWMSTVNGQRIAFAYHPSELEQISMPRIERSRGRVYLISHPNETTFDASFAASRLGAFLQFAGSSPQEACAVAEGCGDIPVRNCTEPLVMVYYRGGNETKAYQQDNCVVLEAPADYELSQLNERAIFQVLGIMP
ncbi:hypothetical protein HY491_01505 [Candidatus Woesearchaeota archaeon]|nr:hypothetical protein [Candidatus Woesearchaeota archaeon]